ncbi:pollen-specific leucine-rich repeat extensin-like protein 1 [Aedes aegypti]|uniref:Uncharacterized protein n=1 Tax=Aedes aegypti TaxID=7159 RepID=A0A6I8T846_AEDAE|nr:pollen-specific leucine-rich repeat extensin-like protein 1 [Aedes aegypti]
MMLESNMQYITSALQFANICNANTHIFTMRFTFVMLVVLLAGVTLTSAKPLILTKAFLRYVLPTITAKVAGLSGLSGLTGLTGLTALGSHSNRLGGLSSVKKPESIGSVYLPNRVYSFLFPKDTINPPASVVYHSLEDYCVPDPFVPPPPPPPVPVPPPVAFPQPIAYPPVAVPVAFPPPPAAIAYPPPPPPPAPLPVGPVAQTWEQDGAQTTVNVDTPLGGPSVYIAETPAGRHEAPLPGFNGPVLSSNTAPAPGTSF